MSLSMSIISVRFDFAVGRGGKLDAVGLEVDGGEWVDWVTVKCRIVVAVVAVAADPSSNQLWAGSFHCVVCHVSVESAMIHDTNRRNCRRIALIGFVGLTRRRLNLVVECI